MKKTATLITNFVFLSIFAAISARATLIWNDNFQYTNGSLAATNTSLTAASNSVSLGLWLRESGSASPSDMYVVNSNLQVTATGGAYIGRQDDCCRYFATTNGTTPANLLATYGNTNYDHPQLLYVSFTVICSTTISNGAGLPNGVGTYFASFYSNTNYGAAGGIATTNANGYGYFGRVQAFTNGSILPNTWRLGVSDNAISTNAANGGFPADLAVNTPYQVVEELDPTPSGLQAATIWINPININQSGSSPVDPDYTASDSLGKALVYGVNSYAFRQPSSFGSAAFVITNLAVATTFAEAMTNVCATNAVPPTIVYQPVGVSNYVGSSISLSAVANGQGLGSMTYQWQQNGNNYNGGNGGTANILTISSAQTTDSGNFTLIATTPYGLSATSFVAKVSITEAPVPPSFVTEPVSQTVYAGQSVVFSTTVISPGNVSYQWKSNNVNIAGANASTLEFDNVTTNLSASYSVGVTNDVVPNGIVSTNAVLTVLNPAQVTIAYLRTLVDPNNGYAATNSPPTIPYQITGTVTTYTNTTSGNTASYYLQDGTAGIDLFVTGGSTFRPAQGDVVTCVGVLSSYVAGLEIDVDTTDGSALPYTSVTDTGLTNALPAPISIGFDIATNLDNLNYNLQGSLVKLSGVYFGTNAGVVISTTANVYFIVTNSIGQSFQLSFFDLDQNTAGQTLPAYASSVTGVLYGWSTNTYYSVAVTRFSDIVAGSPPVLLGAGFSGGNLTFNWSDATFSLQSATNVTGPYTTIPGATSGFVTNTASGKAMFFRLYHP